MRTLVCNLAAGVVDVAVRNLEFDGEAENDPWFRQQSCG